MRNLILGMMVIGAFMASCTNNGKKAETKDAEKVEVVKTNTTATYASVVENSNLNWRATHLGGLQPRFGKVFVKEASILVDNGMLNNAKVVVDMSSLNVESFPEGAEEIGKLTGHLLSADFFEVEKYPFSTFELTAIVKADGDFNSTVTGNLTIKEITKSIIFNANVNVGANEVSIVSEDFKIDRTDWNLTYNTEGTAGVPVDYLIANDIGFKIDVKVTK